MRRDPNRHTPTEPRAAWREEKTSPGVPRTGIERQLPPYGPARQLPPAGHTEESDRETLLRAMAEMEERFGREIAASRRASMAPKPHDWQATATKLVAAFSLLAGVVGALRPTKDERVAPAYEEMGKALASIQARQDRTDSSLEGLRAWLDGYLTSTGVKVPPNKSAPPPLVVELQPAPLVTNDTITPSQAPAIQVKTPIPAPPPSAKPVVLKPLPHE